MGKKLLIIVLYSLLPIWITFVTSFLTIPTNLEPSDILFRNGKLYVVDDGGKLLVMDENGRNRKILNVGGDLEAITFVQGDDKNVHIGVENTANILKVNTLTGSISSRTTLPNFPANSNSGMESLHYISHLDVYLAGSQETGYVYLYKRTVTGKRQLHCKFKPYNGVTDLSSMTQFGMQMMYQYDTGRKVLYFDISKITRANMCQMAGKLYYKGRKRIPHSDVEGIAYSSKYVFLAVDTGDVLRYTLSEFNKL